MSKTEYYGYFHTEATLERLVAAGQGNHELTDFKNQTTIDWAFFCALVQHPSVFASEKPEKRNDFVLFSTLLSSEFDPETIMVELAKNKGKVWFVQIHSHVVYMIGLHWDERGSGFNAYLNVRKLDGTTPDLQQWRRLFTHEVNTRFAAKKRVTRERVKKRKETVAELQQSQLTLGFE